MDFPLGFTDDDGRSTKSEGLQQAGFGNEYNKLENTQESEQSNTMQGWSGGEHRAGQCTAVSRHYWHLMAMTNAHGCKQGRRHTRGQHVILSW